MIIHFQVFGTPIPKYRAKHFYNPKTKRGWGYKPKRSEKWEDLVAEIAQNYIPKDGPLQSPLFVKLSFTLLKPKSAPKKLKHHIKRPDLSNLVKAIEDGLKGRIYRDDSQIVFLSASKAFGNKPGVDIYIEEISPYSLANMTSYFLLWKGKTKIGHGEHTGKKHIG